MENHRKSPYAVIKSRYVTEKTSMLQNLQTADANKSLKKCDKPKVAFLVDQKATKLEIKKAVEEIYRDNKIKVMSVNTITMKPKKRRVRGFLGFRSGSKKAIVTLRSTDSIEAAV